MRRGPAAKSAANNAIINAGEKTRPSESGEDHPARPSTIGHPDIRRRASVIFVWTNLAAPDDIGAPSAWLMSFCWRKNCPRVELRNNNNYPENRPARTPTFAKSSEYSTSETSTGADAERPRGERNEVQAQGTPMKIPLNVAVRGLFAAPVAVLEVPNAIERNAALTAVILKKRQETPSVQASNAGGWHSDREILVWGGAPVVEILDIAKELEFATEDGLSVGAAETIRPRPGLLFMFPSWLFHQVRPYRGMGVRISIAFNLSV